MSSSRARGLDRPSPEPAEGAGPTDTLIWSSKPPERGTFLRPRPLGSGTLLQRPWYTLTGPHGPAPPPSPVTVPRAPSSAQGASCSAAPSHPSALGLCSAVPSAWNVPPPGVRLAPSLTSCRSHSHRRHLATGASPHNPVKNPNPPPREPPRSPGLPLGSLPTALSTVQRATGSPRLFPLVFQACPLVTHLASTQGMFSTIVWAENLDPRFT